MSLSLPSNFGGKFIGIFAGDAAAARFASEHSITLTPTTLYGDLTSNTFRAFNGVRWYACDFGVGSNGAPGPTGLPTYSDIATAASQAAFALAAQELQALAERQGIALGATGPTGPIGSTGPVGAAGATGASLAPPAPVEFTAPTDGARTVSLPRSAVIAFLCINGMRQSQSSFSLAGSTVTLPSTLNIIAGDLITVDYY